MTAGWVSAAVVAGVVALVLPTALRRTAFRTGFFQRGEQTDRSRLHRRTTVGGVATAVAVAAGALAGEAIGDLGDLGPSGGAVAAGAAVVAVTGLRRDRGRGARVDLIVGWILAAGLVTLLDVRAEVTGLAVTDGIVTALVLLAAMAGCASLTLDGSSSTVAVLGGGGLLAAGLGTGEPAAAVLGATLVGAGVGLGAHTLPPATTSTGRTGGAVVGLALAVALIELRVDRALAHPVVALALLGPLVAPAAVDGLARLRRRSWWARPMGLDERVAVRRRVRGRNRDLLPLVVVAVAVGAGATVAALVATATVDPVSGLGAAVVVIIAATVATRSPDARLEPRVGVRRPLVAVAGLAVVVVVVAGAMAALAVLDARRALVDGREAAETGLDAATDGDVETAERAFAAAETAFAEADERLASPALTAALAVPGVGPNVAASRTVAAAGLDLSLEGVRLAARAEAEELVVADGAFPVEATRRLGADLTAVLGTLRRVGGTLDDARSPYLLDPVAVAVDELAERVDEAVDASAVAADVASTAPALLGADETRRYALLVLSPSEARGGGGLVGAVGQLVATDGRLELSEFEPVSQLNQRTDPDRQAEAIDPVYATSLYRGFFPERNWQNLSLPPDFPTVARSVEAAYPLAGGEELDGVIAVDPIGLAALLTVTGPVEVAPWPEPITAENAVQILLFDAYVQIDEAAQDAFIGEVARTVFEQLTESGEATPPRLAAAVGPTVAAGHLRFHATRADEQALFERLVADGAAPDPDSGGDSLVVVTQNGSESKIDWFTRRAVAYEVAYDPASGATTATATVTLTNTAPVDGLPRVVLGGGVAAAGTARTFVQVHSPLELAGGRVDGDESGFGRGVDGGANVYQAVVEVPAGETVTVSVDLVGTLAPGDYRLAIGHQATVVPDDVTVDLTVAAGWRAGPVGGADGAGGDTARRIERRFRLDGPRLVTVATAAE